MASKAQRVRQKSKKSRTKPSSDAKAASKKTADNAFFRPFAELATKGRKGKPDKEDKGSSGNAATKAERAKQQGDAASPSGMGGEGEKERMPSDDARGANDAEVFAMYMAGVRVLSDRKGRVSRSASEAMPKTQAPIETRDFDADARRMLSALVTEGIRFEVTDDGERIEGRRLDVDPREVRRLRRGAYTVDGRLDLHGMNVGEARQEVEKFVRKRSRDGDRVVALIHGRGNHSPRGIGVLRGEIAAWLSQGPAAHHVAAFASAPEDEGGTGVVLALLAR